MGRGRRDKVNLTGEQRENLEQISRNGYAPAKKILHARILLMCDEGEQAKRKWTDAAAAPIIALCCSQPPSGRAEWTIRLLTSELKQRQDLLHKSRQNRIK